MHKNTQNRKITKKNYAKWKKITYFTFLNTKNIK